MTFTTKQQKGVVALAATLAGILIVYLLFFLSDPAKEGATLAQRFCDCQQQNLEKQIQTKRLFLSKGPSSASNQQALRDSLLRIEEQYDLCRHAAKAEVNKKLRIYLSSPKDSRRLKQAIEENVALWTSPDSIKLRNIDNKLVEAGYNRRVLHSTEEMSFGKAFDNLLDLYGSLTGAIAESSAELDLRGWLFESQPAPKVVGSKSGSVKFKISVSESGKVLAAVKASGNVSPEQEKLCYESLVGRTLIRASADADEDTGIVEFNFSVKETDNPSSTFLD